MRLESRNLTHNYTESGHFLTITYTGMGHHPHAVRILWSVQRIVKMDCQPLWRIYQTHTRLVHKMLTYRGLLNIVILLADTGYIYLPLPIR